MKGVIDGDSLKRNYRDTGTGGETMGHTYTMAKGSSLAGSLAGEIAACDRTGPWGI